MGQVELGQQGDDLLFRTPDDLCPHDWQLGDRRLSVIRRIPAIVATLAINGGDRIGFNGRQCGLA
jgi:hypothetical protein